MKIVDLIDTRLGTNNQYSIGKGNVLPITSAPFGMNHFVMQTRQNDVRFYHPNDASNMGIRITHQPSPWMGDFGFINLNAFSLTDEVYQQVEAANSKDSLFMAHQFSGYRASDATFQPNRLTFERLRDKLYIDLIPNVYGAQLSIRRHFQERLKHPFFSIGIAQTGFLRVSEDGLTVTGYTNQLSGSKYKAFGTYFNFHFSQSVTLYHQTDYSEEDHPMTAYYLELQDRATSEITINFAASYISVEQAAKNLDTYLTAYPTKAAQLAQITDEWEAYLGKIEVTHTDHERVKTFYANLYRTALFPQTAHEIVDGQVKHFSPYSQEVEPGYFYTSSGYWDTFRSNYPLYALLIPERIPEFINSILSIAREDRYLPKWLSPDERGLMPGTLVDGVIADAVVKGLVDTNDAQELLEAMIFNADTPSDHELEGREGGHDYAEYGYLPADYHESVNKTLDYAYSDFCIAQVANYLDQTEIAERYYARSLSYRHLYQDDLKQMVAKDREGTFVKQEVAHRWGQHYTEGSAWQNSLSVFHNVADLIDLYGGDQAFYEHLEKLVNSEPLYETGGYGIEIHEMIELAIQKFGQLAISNQPSFHIPHLFIYAGYPHMSHIVLKDLMLNVFGPDINGYPGDEDNGSLASWFVLNSLGLYSVTPGTEQYVLGISIWKEATIHLDNGNKVELISSDVEAYLNIVQSRTVNGEVYTKQYVTYQQLMDGLKLEQRLGMIPAIQAIAESDRPYSLKNNN